jgi:hypothetical protein
MSTDNPHYVIGLYADAKGFARIRLTYTFQGADHLVYCVEHVSYSNFVTVKAIQESLIFNSRRGFQAYYHNVFINNFPALAEIVGGSKKFHPEMVEINPHNSIFLTTCLLNENRIQVEDDFKGVLMDSLNSYNPNDETPNHRVMALFLALESCWG